MSASSSRSTLLIVTVALLVSTCPVSAGPNANAILSLDLISGRTDAVISFASVVQCPGDFDDSGEVNFSDFLAFSRVYGARSSDANYMAAMDMDGSGEVDFSDFLAFSRVFGTTCDQPPPQSAERDALIALYNATDGPNWRFNTNWLSERPLSEWYGVTTDASGRVTELRLYAIATSDGDTVGIGDGVGRTVGNGLTGSIPVALGSLTNLQRLHLAGNQLTGSIPVALGSLTNLQWLYLYSNQLTGSIPAALGSLTNLQRLSLGDNQLTGSIPVALGSLTNLQWLYLYSNQLTGSIPAALGSLTNLQRLSLGDNQLTGSIPVELGSLTNLQRLGLSNNSGLSGPLPVSFTGLDSLDYLYVDGTGLCAPTAAAFQTWLDGIENKRGVVNCDGVEESSVPTGIWSDGTTMWVAHVSTDDDNISKIYAYDRATGQRAPSKDFDTLSSAGNNQPAGIWSDGTTMWVANFTTDDSDDDNIGKIYAYDMDTKARVPGKDFNTLTAAGNFVPIGIWSDGETMWVADFTSDDNPNDYNKIYAYDMDTKARVPGKDFKKRNPIGSWKRFPNRHLVRRNDHVGRELSI